MQEESLEQDLEAVIESVFADAAAATPAAPPAGHSSKLAPSYGNLWSGKGAYRPTFNMTEKAPLLYHMTRLWHGNVAPSVFRRWKRGLEYLVIILGDEEWDYITTCSGSDIDVKCMEALEEYYRNELNIELKFLHVASCEIMEKKQAFLLAEFPLLRFLFENLCHLTSIKALDVKSGLPQYVPRTRSQISGFSCLGRTRMNKNSAKNKGCVQLGTTETGVTFIHQADLIIRARSKVSALENVKELSEKTASEADEQQYESDVEFIIEYFKPHGFSVKVFRFCCTGWGSRVARLRLYFLIWETSGMPEWLVREAFALAEEMFMAMRYDQLPADEFLLTDEQLAIWSQHMGPQQAVDSGGSTWLEKHQEIFPQLGLSWPPDLGDLKPVLMPMGLRAAETAYACHIGFPLTVDNEWQFIEANSSLERNLRYPPAAGKAISSPWTTTCRTFTSLSKVVIRKRDADGKITIRQLHPIEQMRMIGWDLGHWRRGPQLWSSSVDPPLLGSLAGNAFSAFAFTPLWSASLGAYGHLQSRFKQLSKSPLAPSPCPTKTEVDTASDSDSGF